MCVFRCIPPALLLAAACAVPLLVTAARAGAAPAKSGDLAAVIDEMNAASAKFTSAQADLRQEIYTKVVQDTETRIGQIYLERKSGSVQMGMTLLAAGASAGAPPSQIFEFANGKLRMLTTGDSQIDVYNTAGKNQALAETLMSLGFGGSGADLEKTFAVTDDGPDTIDGAKVEKLDLVAKDPDIRNKFSRITIWIDPTRDVTLKQVLYNAANGQPTGDTRTVYYTDIRVNQPVNMKPFELKCKGKCTVINH